MRCQLSQNLSWFIWQQQLGHIHRALLQYFKGWTDTACDREFNQRLQLGWARNANMDRNIDACIFDRVGPFNDRTSLKRKLSGQRHFSICCVVQFLFPAQSVHDVLIAAAWIDIFVTFGMSSNMKPLKTSFVEQPRL